MVVFMSLTCLFPRRLPDCALGKAKECLRRKREVILGCIRQPGFEV